MNIKSEHFTWGQDCHGWWLHKTAQLAVARELMPPQTKEKHHKHAQTEQYFYCLSGLLSIEVDGQLFELEAMQGIGIPAGIVHQVKNNGPEELVFLVISSPHVQDDRIDLPESAL